MKRIVRISLVMMVIAAGAVLAGCGETYEQRTVFVGVPLPMTADDVVAAVKADESDEAIISKLERSGLAGPLTTKDVDRLREEGVSENVLDWMLAHPGRPSAPIQRGTGTVVVEGTPNVVIVERPPPVTWTIGLGYYSGGYGYHSYGRRSYGHHYYGRSSYHRYPSRRTWHSGGRSYHYTSGH